MTVAEVERVLLLSTCRTLALVGAIVVHVGAVGASRGPRVESRRITTVFQARRARVGPRRVSDCEHQWPLNYYRFAAQNIPAGIAREASTAVCHLAR